MVRSEAVMVTTAKIATAISIFVNPTSGAVPLTIVVSGQLTDIDGNGLAGKTINLLMDGVVVDTVASSYDPYALGTYDFYYTIETVGTHTIRTEFLGDAEYEGCGSTISWGKIMEPFNMMAIFFVIGIIVVLVALFGGKK